MEVTGPPSPQKLLTWTTRHAAGKQPRCPRGGITIIIISINTIIDYDMDDITIITNDVTDAAGTTTPATSSTRVSSSAVDGHPPPPASSVPRQPAATGGRTRQLSEGGEKLLKIKY